MAGKKNNKKDGGAGLGKKDGKDLATSLDAIDVFPLEVMPLRNATLKNARLIKNARLETSLELLNDPISGSLQISPHNLAEIFSGDAVKLQEDQELLNKLSALGSFDVYSLRSVFKKLSLETVPEDALDLSDEMKKELGGHSQKFIRPLIEKIYGLDRFSKDGVKDIRDVFKNPDVGLVHENLKLMTEKTGIPLNELPEFLEEYNDVYLSIAYYNYLLENLRGIADRFFPWIQQTQKYREVTITPRTFACCQKAETILHFLNSSLHERLIKVQKNFDVFWQDINHASFKRLQEEITENHHSLGAVLCGLIVKMRAWDAAFPDADAGGPVQRAKFIVAELEPGLEKLQNLEITARKKLGLPEIRG